MRRNVLVFAALLGAVLTPYAAAAQDAAPERIQLQGQWIVEVRNPDGTVAERREFQNALVDAGATALVSMLGGAAAGNWEVTFGNDTGPCTGQLCAIIEENSIYPLSTYTGASENLTVEVIEADRTLELSGSATVHDDGQIEFVRTRLGACDPSSTPQDCDGDAVYEFTEHTLDSAVSVTGGQTVNVTVIFSFS